MPQSSLVKYIREQIRAGYDTNSIKSYLLKYGYTESVINEALQNAYPPIEVKHVFRPSKVMITMIVAVVCSLVLISAGIFMFLVKDKVPDRLLDVQIDLITSSVELGGELRFTTQIFNLGKSERYDVPLRYEIYTLDDTLVKFKEETIALETRASSSVVISLDGVGPGSYYVKAIAVYADKTAKATVTFRIVEGAAAPVVPEPIVPVVPEPVVPTPADACPINCNDNNECTNDYCNGETNYACRNDIIYPCCGNGNCEAGENYDNCLADCEVPARVDDAIFEGKSVWEKIDMISDIAKNDKTKALGYCEGIEQMSYRYDCLSKVAASSGDDSVCDSIEDESTKDSCYKDFATENKDNSVCDKVVKDSKRDQCYMDFASKGDYTVCDKLVNKYLKQSCESLKSLSEMQT